MILNSGKCSKCGEFLVSVHRHDFRACRCDESFVDGGFDYQRCGGSIVPLVNPCFVFATKEAEVIVIVRGGNTDDCDAVFLLPYGKANTVECFEKVAILENYFSRCSLIDAWEEG